MFAEVLSPLPGLVATVHVKAGDAVSAGEPVVTLQSMKMEIPVNSEIDGRVLELAVAPGDVIHEGDLIAVVSND